MQTTFFTHREHALPLINSKRINVPWARLLDAPAIKMALRFDEGCIWDAPRVAAILGVSYAARTHLPTDAWVSQQPTKPPTPFDYRLAVLKERLRVIERTGDKITVDALKAEIADIEKNGWKPVRGSHW